MYYFSSDIELEENQFSHHLLDKLGCLPDNAQLEVLDFVQFLEWRKENRQKSQLSVVSLSQD